MPDTLPMTNNKLGGSSLVPLTLSLPVPFSLFDILSVCA